MSELMVVAFLVSCSSDLLHCRTLDTEQLAWADFGTCNDDLPRLVRGYARAGYPNVMGKCRIVLDDSRYKRRAIG